MKEQSLLDINLVLYHNDKPVGVCTLDYIGLLGMRVKGLHLKYPDNRTLEVEVIGPNKMCVDNSRVPVVVSSSDDEGIGLQLESFDEELVQRWSGLLSEVYSTFKNEKCNFIADTK